MNKMPVLAAIAICSLDLALSGLIYFLHSVITANVSFAGHFSVAGDFIFFRMYYGQILAQAFLLALWFRLLAQYHLIGVLISAQIPFLLVSWYGFGATPDNVWELYSIASSMFGTYDLMGGGLVLLLSGIISFFVVSSILGAPAPNKGFNRTPESSGPAKPGKRGSGAG